MATAVPKPPPRPAALLDPEEAAALLGVTTEFMRRMARQRRIRSVKVGKFVRFDPADLQHWIDQNSRDAQAG